MGPFQPLWDLSAHFYSFEIQEKILFSEPPTYPSVLTYVIYEWYLFEVDSLNSSVLRTGTPQLSSMSSISLQVVKMKSTQVFLRSLNEKGTKLFVQYCIDNLGIFTSSHCTVLKWILHCHWGGCYIQNDRFVQNWHQGLL